MNDKVALGSQKKYQDFSLLESIADPRQEQFILHRDILMSLPLINFNYEGLVIH